MSIYNKLYPWQQGLVQSILDKKAFGLWLDMGLGKTPISLALAEQHHCSKVIVITINSKALEPETVSGSWLNWANESDVKYTYSIKKNTHFDLHQNDFFLINYESLFVRSKSKKTKTVLSPHVEAFIKACVGHNVCIIVDESHKMKDLNSQQTLAINKLKKAIEYVASCVYLYLLTGTPFTTGYIDLYSQLKTLGYDEPKYAFIDDFCIRGNVPGLLGWQQPIVGYKNIDKLYEVVHKYAVTIESDLVIKLPEQVFVEHTLPMSDEIRLFTNEKVQGEYLAKYLKSENVPDEISGSYTTPLKINNPLYRDIAYDFITHESSKYFAETSGTFWLRSRQLSTGFIGNAEDSIWYDWRRVLQLKEFLKENPDNYLLFYNYTPELLMLYNICEELGYNIDVYCGEMKSLVFYEKYSKQSAEQRLSNTKNIILANFASGSTGLNWQNYNKCIIFSLPLYKDWAQGIKRIHRVGQTQTTIYHVFYQNNFLDKGMYKALKEQIDYNKEMFESDLLRAQSFIE